MSYLLSMTTLAAIYVILSVSLSLLIGHLGIFSMAHAALFGIGSYGFAVLTVKAGWNLLPALLAAIALAGLAGAVMAAPTLRVTGEYFLVASFALQLVASSVFQNWTPVTGGTGGIPGITRPTLAGINFSPNANFAALTVVVALLVVGISIWVVRSPFGRMMHVVRDDEMVAMTLGKSIASTKFTVTVLAGAFAGLAGVLYAQHLMYISPDAFEVATSMTVITMVVVGGMTSVAGSAVGGVIIILIPQLLQQLDLSEAVAGPLVQVIFGVLLVTLMLLRPNGLFGERIRPRRPEQLAPTASPMGARGVGNA